MTAIPVNRVLYSRQSHRLPSSLRIFLAMEMSVEVCVDCWLESGSETPLNDREKYEREKVSVVVRCIVITRPTRLGEKARGCSARDSLNSEQSKALATPPVAVRAKHSNDLITDRGRVRSTSAVV
jgi:hypothetical protein